MFKGDGLDTIKNVLDVSNQEKHGNSGGVNYTQVIWVIGMVHPENQLKQPRNPTLNVHVTYIQM